MPVWVQLGLTIFLPLGILALTINMINKTNIHWNPQCARHCACVDHFSHLAQGKHFLLYLEQRKLNNRDSSSFANVQSGARKATRLISAS